VGRLVSPPLDPQERRECERQSGAARLVFASLPDEREYRALLESSRIVFCKNGFQQMVESLALGTPVIASEVEGGVADFTLDGAMQPFVKFLPPTPAAWSEALALARQWLVARPAMPWTHEIEKLASPARTGAEMFAGFLHDVVASRHAREARWNPGS
jgi:glycosyltransferase involved in cell wall biosynthesis